MKPLVVITGPTAVGKTELSIKIAKAIDGEIISADSIQVYKHMVLFCQNNKRRNAGNKALSC